MLDVIVLGPRHRQGQESWRPAETLYQMVQHSVRDGINRSHRSSPWRSRKHCGYRRECEREYGGRVPE